MKISLYIPKNTKNQQQFVRKEIQSAQNIQDTNHKNNTISNLNKLLYAL